MRRLNFITAGLTLALSAVVEILFFFIFLFFGSANQPNWLSQTFTCFHYPAVFLMFGLLDPDQGDFWQSVLYVIISFFIAVLQWWLIILAGIWSIRHFRRKSV
jgi:hypothetical protein